MGPITYTLLVAGPSHRQAPARLCIATSAMELGEALSGARGAYRSLGVLLTLMCSPYGVVLREVWDGTRWRHVARDAEGCA